MMMLPLLIMIIEPFLSFQERFIALPVAVFVELADDQGDASDAPEEGGKTGWFCTRPLLARAAPPPDRRFSARGAAPPDVAPARGARADGVRPSHRARFPPLTADLSCWRQFQKAPELSFRELSAAPFRRRALHEVNIISCLSYYLQELVER
jgi:hypothetical protein